MWDFETDPEYQAKLDWVDTFMREEVEPLDFAALDPYDKTNPDVMAVLRPLQQQVREHGLWAAHLTPELGGQGYGQVQLALLNEILGRSRWAPSVFGCQAPDSGNAEILALFGTEEQKQRYLQPLLDGEISSCYSMTEPQGGSDPGLFVTRAERDGDSWVINGEKWFSSNARHASFFIVMAVTNPEARTRDKMSLFIVPAETPGIEIVRNVGVGGESSDHGIHGYVRYTDVRVPADHVLGGEGQAFAIAQTRLGGGRIHHAMRTIALARRAFDMMCERAVSRQTRQGPLSNFQLTQEKIADSWIQIEQFRLLVLRTAWLIDKHHDYQLVRRDIAAVKVAMPQVSARRGPAGHAPARRAGRLQRDAVREDDGGGRVAGHRRRTHRGAQTDARAAHAQGVRARRHDVPVGAHPHPACRRGRPPIGAECGLLTRC